MPSSWDHNLAGGHPVLDFVNTVDDWTKAGAPDYFTTFADAERFGEAVGLISRREALQLAESGSDIGRAAAGELRSLRQLRASLERIVRASIESRQPPQPDLAVIHRGFVEAVRATELVASPGAPLSRRIGVDANGPVALRLRILDAAMALLQSDALRQVKACPTCGWYFLDVSKNQSRVWCSMDSCGARAKARRYYHRTKRRSSSSGSRRARSRS